MVFLSVQHFLRSPNASLY